MDAMLLQCAARIAPNHAAPLSASAGTGCTSLHQQRHVWAGSAPQRNTPRNARTGARERYGPCRCARGNSVSGSIQARSAQSCAVCQQERAWTPRAACVQRREGPCWHSGCIPNPQVRNASASAACIRPTATLPILALISHPPRWAPNVGSVFFLPAAFAARLVRPYRGPGSPRNRGLAKLAAGRSHCRMCPGKPFS
jgi:hypothetical protein